MKIRVWDRILIALAGLILIAGCGLVIAQVFFQVDTAGLIGSWLNNSSTAARVLVIIAALALLALGIFCLLMIFRHKNRDERFVQQKTESGSLEISITALEALVRKCLEQHPELDTQKLTLESRREGLLITITGNLAGGISMPLTVDLIQRQIKQYVTACSGVAVRDILMQIEASGEPSKDSPFAVEAPAGMLLLKEGEGEAPAEEEPEAEPAEPAEEAAEPVPEVRPEPDEAPVEEEPEKEEPVSPIHTLRESSAGIMQQDEDDDRPIHQRLFSPKAEPCIVPVPPEMEAEEKEPVTAQEEKAGKDEKETVTPERTAQTEENGHPEEKDHPEENGEQKEDSSEGGNENEA
ncbi:MAG: alkaline shock response membrane anchor protein AmaP [Clostridia bacterium]|nr:alkaline shock response membrane anchor protein AmaP [Clostridia bacterium]